MLQHHLVTCALKMSLFVTALQTYRYQPINYVKREKRPWCFSFFHPYCSANDKDCGPHLFLFGLESCSYLVHRLLSLTQAEIDCTQNLTSKHGKFWDKDARSLPAEQN